MLRFVLNHWRRQRFKFILTLVGALIISAGLSLMFNLTDSSQGTVEQTLQKNGHRLMISSSGQKAVK